MSGEADPAQRAMEDYSAKVSRELSPKRPHPAEGLPAGDPESGLLLVLETPASPDVLDALRRSLESVGHPHARVVAADGRLLEEILSGGPAAIVTVGPGAAGALDGLGYELARTRFSDERGGEWFHWSKAVRGLALPSLAPALEDEEAKQGFWRSFLALRALETD